MLALAGFRNLGVIGVQGLLRALDSKEQQHPVEVGKGHQRSQTGTGLGERIEDRRSGIIDSLVCNDWSTRSRLDLHQRNTVAN